MRTTKDNTRSGRQVVEGTRTGPISCLLCGHKQNKWHGDIQRISRGDVKTQGYQVFIWVRLKIKQEGYAGVGPCFHLPGFHFGTVFLSHSHLDKSIFTRVPWLSTEKGSLRFKGCHRHRQIEAATTDYHDSQAEILWGSLYLDLKCSDFGI